MHRKEPRNATEFTEGCQGKEGLRGKQQIIEKGFILFKGKKGSGAITTV